MKKLLLFLPLLALTTFAATITGPIADLTGGAYGARIEFWPYSTPFFSGTTAIVGPMRSVAITNGNFSTTLVAGRYLVKFPPTTNAFIIYVPTGTDTYGLSHVATNVFVVIDRASLTNVFDNNLVNSSNLPYLGLSTAARNQIETNAAYQAYLATNGFTSGSVQSNISYVAVTNAPWANTNAPTLFNPFFRLTGAQDFTTLLLDDDGGTLKWDTETTPGLHLNGDLSVTGTVSTAGNYLGNGANISFVGSAFNGNLATSVDTIQELANAIDDLSLPGGGISAGTATNIANNQITASNYFNGTGLPGVISGRSIGTNITTLTTDSELVDATNSLYAVLSGDIIAGDDAVIALMGNSTLALKTNDVTAISVNLTNLNLVAGTNITWTNLIAGQSATIAPNLNNQIGLNQITAGAIYGADTNGYGFYNSAGKLVGTNNGYGFTNLQPQSFAAMQTQKPRRGTATYLMSYNGTSWNTGGGATNLDCYASESVMLSHLTNNIEWGLPKYGYDWLCLEEGWQSDSTWGAWDSTRFPSGPLAFVQKVHSMGYKLALYTDLSDLTCCGHWGSGDSNTVAAANLFSYWGIDWLHVDSCGFQQAGDTSPYWGDYTEAKRKQQFLDFVAALRATNSSIGITYNLNLSPYEPWVGEVFNAWQLTENGDFPVYWSTLKMIDKAELSNGQFRRGHHPMFYGLAKMQCYGTAGNEWPAGSGGAFTYPDQTFGNGYYGLPMLTWGAMAMWQSELMPFNNLLAWDGLSGVPANVGAELMTNAGILRINGDTLDMPPIKSFTNGTVEGWVKELDTGEKALLVFNRGYSTNMTAVNGLRQTNYLANYILSGTSVVASAVSLTVPVTAFGFRTNEQATFTQVLANTNYSTTTTFTIPCPTNHCTLWLVSAAISNEYRGNFTGNGTGLTGVTASYTNNTSLPGVLTGQGIGTNQLAFEDVDEAVFFSAERIETAASTGGAVTPNTYTAYGPTPYFNRNGLAHATGSNNTNGEARFAIPIHPWATNAEVRICLYSAYAGSVAWTNFPRLEVYSPASRVQYEPSGFASGNFSNTVSITTNGVWCWITNTCTFPNTNAPRNLLFTLGVVSNSTARYIIGPALVRQCGPRL